MTVSLSLVYGQQQYFRVQPRDVKVQEGGEAMLECEVANLAGQVQWTKDGFALGKNCIQRKCLQFFLKNFLCTALIWEHKQELKENFMSTYFTKGVININ